MVEALEDGRHRAGEVGEVAHPALVAISRPVDIHGHEIRMTVQPGALVTDRHTRQPVGGLERELLEYLHENSSVLPRQGTVESGGQIIRAWARGSVDFGRQDPTGVGDTRGDADAQPVKSRYRTGVRSAHRDGVASLAFASIRNRSTHG